VTALVNYTVDEITSERMGTVTMHVKRLIQERLDELESGIKVESVNLFDSRWPRQVNDAFEGLHKFSQMRDTMISEARSYAQNKLIEAQAHAEERIAQARANRTMRVETARANAEYLQQILPEYRKRPKLIIEEIYLAALEDIFENLDEQFVVESADKLRLLLNRDPKIKPKSGQDDNQEN
jgi:membrane protease subunit HflK